MDLKADIRPCLFRFLALLRSSIVALRLFSKLSLAITTGKSNSAFHEAMLKQKNTCSTTQSGRWSRYCRLGLLSGCLGKSRGDKAREIPSYNSLQPRLLCPGSLLQ